MIKVKRDLIIKKMTEHQIVAILKEAEAGIPVKELCRKYGKEKEFVLTLQQGYRLLRICLETTSEFITRIFREKELI
ncbi:hypothetical protein [Gilliamella sp. Choc5-1]|jgi:hypothetical protein|uniref:hypothetical protein n=1 Tax=Gilliamella sp. Choc5-1 TaxID=3120238 RepID=UPI0009C17868|nr:hypothetical protein [Gilliamella apicola]